MICSFLYAYIGLAKPVYAQEKIILVCLFNFKDSQFCLEADFI